MIAVKTILTSFIKRSPLFIVAALVPISVAPLQAQAVAINNFSPGRIIDDSIFFNPSFMDASQIQAFLNAKTPTCDTDGSQSKSYYYNADSGRINDSRDQYVTTSRAVYGNRYDNWRVTNSLPARGASAPFICLKDYRMDVPSRPADSYCPGSIIAGNKTAAQIIDDTAKACNINPAVLLVLLQKEQSLVTDDWPWGRQYEAATGYKCPDTAPCDPAFAGLFSQVYYGARQFQLYAKNPGNYNYRSGVTRAIQYNPDTSCGSSDVYIETQATAGLYNYTPYQPNQAALSAQRGTTVHCGAYGNLNFWRLFNDWFGTTITGAYPSPLYRSETSGMIYAVVDAKKYYIPSYDILVAYGFHTFPIANVSDSYLSGFSTGTTLTNIGRKEYDPNGAIFLFDDGKHYQIKDPDQCTQWGIDCFNPNVAKVLPNVLMDRYITGAGFLPTSVKNQGTTFLLENGKKRPVVGPLTNQIFSSAPFFKDINVTQPLGKALIDDRYITKFGNAPTIYLHDRTKLHALLDTRDITDWNMQSLNGSNLPTSFDSDPLTRSSALRPLARNLNGQFYIVSNGIRYPLGERTADFSMLQHTSFDYPDSQLDRLTSKPLTDVLRARDSGEIFTVSSGKKRVFASMEDIKGLGFNPHSITNIPQPIANELGYDGLNLAQGRLFKVAGTSEIRLRFGDGYKYVSRLDYPGLDYSKTLNVDGATGNLYSYLGIYQP